MLDHGEVDKEQVEGWDTQMVIYTSGTTGPSKGVLISYVQRYSSAEALYWITGADRCLIVNPLFHVSGVGMVVSALAKGASFALVPRFSVTTFWDVVRETEATCITLMGVAMRAKAGSA